MAHNPVLRNDPAFRPGGSAQYGYGGTATAPRGPYDPQGSYGQMPGQYDPRATAPQYGAPQAPQQVGRQQSPWGQQPQGGPDQLESAYQRPSAGAADRGQMTYNHVINTTGIVLGVLLIAAFVGFTVGRAIPSLSLVFWIGGAIGGLVLGLVNSFKRNPSPPLIVAYAALEGLFLGSFSSFMEYLYPNIIMQSVVGTLSVFAAVLLLFRSGKVRTSPRMNKIFMVAMVGVLIFSVANVFMMLFGVTEGMFGLRSQFPLLGIGIGVLSIFLAAYSFVMDFEDIVAGVRNGIPAKMAWRVAFGLTVTLVWLYVEILRLIAILRGSD
jgi:uncharacterized YccA/Bax inhibitor family protein